MLVIPFAFYQLRILWTAFHGSGVVTDRRTEGQTRQVNRRTCQSSHLESVFVYRLARSN